ncbi:hypothetical protein AGMMS49525_00530 [Bacteroidia bacterium]|nr:hypothetical protein AGMMS49525_00530 [Bacteroidia bacterium]
MVCTSLRAQTIIEDLAKNPTTSEGQIHIKADAGVNALIGRAGNGEILQKNAPTPTPPAIATTVSNAEQYEQKNSAVSQKSSVPTAADISAAIAAAKARMSAVPAVTTSNTPSNPVAATTNPDPPVPAKVVGMDISDLAEDDIVHVAGFRVQVYFGNAQNKARTEAEQRQSAVKNKFPGIGTYMTYSPPNFKVTVGDFLTREDAEVFKQLLIKALPFGRESFIVPAKIKSANF